MLNDLCGMDMVIGSPQFKIVDRGLNLLTLLLEQECAGLLLHHL
jgi:hypothetical protein